MTPIVIAALAWFAPPPSGLCPGAVAQLGSSDFHFRGDGRATFVAVNPARTRAAVSTADDFVTEYDLVTGRPGWRFRADSPAGYSADGRTLDAIARPELQGTYVVSLDVATGREVGRVPYDGKPPAQPEYLRGTELKEVHRVADSVDGKYRAAAWTTFETASREKHSNSLTVHEAATGREVFRVALPDWWTRLAFAPDGRSVVAVGGRGVSRFAVPSGTLLQQRRYGDRTPPWFAGELAVSADGAYLLTIDKAGDLTAFDGFTGERSAYPLRGPLCFEGVPGASDFYVAAAGNRISVWDLRTGRPRHDPTGATTPITAVALLADGGAVTAETNCLRTWDAAGKQGHAWAVPSAAPATWARLSPDGRHSIHGGNGQPTRSVPPGTGRQIDVRIWPQTGQEIGFRRPLFPVDGSPAFAPDGQALASHDSRQLRLWDVARGAERWATPLDNYDRPAVGFAADGRRLYTADGAGEIREFDARTGAAGRTLRPHPDCREPADSCRQFGTPPRTRAGILLALAATPDGRRLVTADGHSLRLWDLDLGQECALLERMEGSPSVWDRSGSPLAVSPDGGTLAAGGRGDRLDLIDLWELRTGRRIATFDGHKGRGVVTALAFSPDGKRLISGGSDAAAFVWAVPPRPRPSPTPPEPTVPWGDLASVDAGKAYRALAAWSAAPDAAVAAARRLPIDSVDTAYAVRMAAELGSPEFATRVAASAALAGLGPVAIPQLEAAVKSGDLEVATRAAKLLAVARQKRPFARPVVDLLEGIDTPESRALLADWAEADPDGDRGRAAAAAVERGR